MKSYWIIMADIIQSSKKKGDELMNDFRSLVSETNKSFSEEIVSPLTITLGDEFQGVTESIESALEILFFMDLNILKNYHFDLRYVINYGTIDTAINKERSYEMLGEGLTTARRKLNELKKEHRKAFVTGMGERRQKEVQLAFNLYSSLYLGIPSKDRRLMGDFLTGDDYKLLAEKYSRDASSMWRKRKTLRVEDFHTVKELIFSLAEMKA